MSVYRTLFTAIAACVIAAPVLANAGVVTPAVAHQAVTVKQTLPAVNARVNVNQAKAKDLLNIKGINPSIARAIVAYRKKHGEFKSLDDLAKVRVLKKMNATDLTVIQDQLSV